jgi:hypothetical protein
MAGATEERKHESLGVERSDEKAEHEEVIDVMLK